MLSQQPIPHIIHLPQDEVMHRFGYEIAIRKLSRTCGSLDTLYFKVCSQLHFVKKKKYLCKNLTI